MNGLISQKKGYGNRVWEVDLLRGILILFVVFDHVMFDIGAMFADSFSTPLGIRISDWAAGYVFESSAFGRWLLSFCREYPFPFPKTMRCAGLKCPYGRWDCR